MNLFILFLLFNPVLSFSLPKIDFKRDTITKRIDNKVIELGKPATLNYIMNPVIGLVDSYWISVLGGPIQLAGQGCADQALNLAFGFTSFMPLVLTPVIAEHHSNNNNSKVIEKMNSGIVISTIIGSLIAFIFTLFSAKIINFFVSNTSPISTYAIEYLKYRSIAFPFILVNGVIFSVFRGMMDFNSAMKVNFKSQILNLVADPILMKMYGVKGVAIASTLSDVFCTFNYLFLLKNKNMIKPKFNNLFTNISNLLKNGILVQLRLICYNIIYFIMNKKILSFDITGKISATNIISFKIIELFSILYDSLRSVSVIIISSGIFNKSNNIKTVNRILQHGLIISLFQSVILLFYKLFIPKFTNDLIVIEECYKLLPYLIIYSTTNGLSSIIDGILQSKKHYKIQTINSILILGLMLFSLPISKNLQHIWLTITLFSLFRLPINYKFMKNKLIS